MSFPWIQPTKSNLHLHLLHLPRPVPAYHFTPLLGACENSLLSPIPEFLIQNLHFLAGSQRMRMLCSKNTFDNLCFSALRASLAQGPLIQIFSRLLWLWEWRGCRLEYGKGIGLWLQRLSFTLESATLMLGPENPTRWFLSQSPPNTHTTHRSLTAGVPSCGGNIPGLRAHPPSRCIQSDPLFLSSQMFHSEGISALKFPQKHSLVIFPNHSNYLITLILIDLTWHQGVI